jgi:hypothetical protein
MTATPYLEPAGQSAIQMPKNDLYSVTYGGFPSIHMQRSSKLIG